MRAPGFAEGAAVALAGALAASAAVWMLAGALAAPTVLRVVVAGLGLAYVLYLLRGAGVRVGRISALLGWAAATVVPFALGQPLIVHLCVQVAVVWLLRAVCVHRGVLAALADLGLCAASVGAAVWAAERTGSVFLAVWCLLLVHAAHVAIPHLQACRREVGAARGSAFGEAGDRFARAHRAAEAAVRRLQPLR